MPLHKTEAIVIRTIKLGEADKIVTLFTNELGKVRAVAKGVRRTKSRFGSALEPFTHINTSIFVKGSSSLYRMRDTGIIHSYHKIREDINKIAYGLYLLELVDRFLLEGDVNKGVFAFLKDTLNFLSEREEVREVFILFGLHFLRLSGYQYKFDRCISCGDDPLIAFFSPYKGGLICNGCIRGEQRGMFPINKAVALYLNSVKNIDGMIIEPANPDIINEAAEIIKGIFTEIIGRPLLTQEFINEIKG